MAPPGRKKKTVSSLLYCYATATHTQSLLGGQISISGVWHTSDNSAGFATTTG
jgi:hypothetical protein